MKLPHAWSKATPLFHDERLVSCAGLVPVMALAERAGLSSLVAERVRLTSVASRVASAGVNPAGKLTSIIAGMAAGADSIDDLQVIRCGGMKRLFAEVYAPATLGQFLSEFTHGHTLQLASVARAHLISLAERTDLLPGIEEQAYVDIDSLLRPVYGHAKQGASFGHTKISGKQVLRKRLSPSATTISTRGAAPVLAGIRLRAGKAGSGKGAASMVREAVKTARAAGAAGEILVRDDSAYGNSAVVGARVRAKARFSVVLTKNPAVTAAIASIPDPSGTGGQAAPRIEAKRRYPARPASSGASFNASRALSSQQRPSHQSLRKAGSRQVERRGCRDVATSQTRPVYVSPLNRYRFALRLDARQEPTSRGRSSRSVMAFRRTSRTPARDERA